MASRFYNSACRREVAPPKRIAISIRSQLQACCQAETRRDATLVEMRREVRSVCDRSAGICYINLSETWYIVLVAQRRRAKSSIVVL
jgi:hypothetical protein